MATFPPPPSFSKLYWQCRVCAKPRHFHFHHLSNTRPDPHSTRPRELATDSRGAGSGGPFDQYVTRQTSKPVIVSKMGRTIISTAQGGRVRLTTGQARTRVLGMTFRPGPSPLGGPRPRNSKKDGGERGQHLEKTGTNQGEGNHARVRRPSRQLYNGTEGDSRAVTSGSHFTAVTSPRSPHSVAHCQSARATSARL